MRAKQDHPAKEEKSNGCGIGQHPREYNGYGTGQPPREIKSEFLMPSRRHHPQVEPLLATYNILLYQKVAKYVFEPSKNKFHH